MADKDPDYFLARIDGEDEYRMFEATDPRIVRSHVLKDVHPPKVEVRRPSTKEAMEWALDGKPITKLAPAGPAPAPEPAAPGDLIDDAPPGADPSDDIPPTPEFDAGLDDPRIDPDDDGQPF